MLKKGGKIMSNIGCRDIVSIINYLKIRNKKISKEIDMMIVLYEKDNDEHYLDKAKSLNEENEYVVNMINRLSY